MLHEGGLTPRTLVADTPIHFSGYIPENFDRRFRGAVPAREALAWSLNIPAIRMLRQYGIPRFYNLLKKWGMTTLTRPPGGYGLTLILGGAEGTLFQVTRMYAGLRQSGPGDAGRRSEVRLLPDGESRPLPHEGPGPAAAFLTLEALTEVNRPDQEGFWKQFNSSKWVAWKTGTSFGLRDAWSVGMTPAYTVGVWAGNADGEGNPEPDRAVHGRPGPFRHPAGLDTRRRHPGPEPLAAGDPRVPRLRLSGRRTMPGRHRGHAARKPFHPRLPLSPAGPPGRSRRFRVDSACESVERMVHEPWFVLPPLHEYYFRRYHPEYRALPPYRPDCAELIQAESGRQVMSLVYPEANTAVYIPVDLDGKPGQVIFEAIHRRPETVIYWHIDDRYVTATRQFHQIAVDPTPARTCWCWLMRTAGAWSAVLPSSTATADILYSF